MTTIMGKPRRATQTAGPVVQADRTPRVSDLVPGAVVYRWATLHAGHLTSELPCHADQAFRVMYDPGMSPAIKIDQPVVCRRCCMAYDATPVPSTDDFAWYRVVYRVTGLVAISRPKRSGE